MWRKEETDWEAQEEVFEPSMLSDDLPAVGALLGERNEDVVDVERQPWHFESDDTLVIPPEPGYEPRPPPATSPRPRRTAAPSGARATAARAPEPIVVLEPDGVEEDDDDPAGVAAGGPVGHVSGAASAAPRPA